MGFKTHGGGGQSSILSLVRGHQLSCAFGQPILFKESKPIAASTASTKHSSGQSVKSAEKESIGAQSRSTDIDGYTPPVKVLFPRDALSVQYSMITKVGAGLKNYGNTCFCNATLQSLMHTAPLVGLLVDCVGRQRECILCILEELCQQCNTSTQPVAPKRLIQRLPFIDRSFSAWRQSDAHEFKVKLFERIEKSLLAPFQSLGLDFASKGTTVLHQIFGGFLQSQVKCIECNYMSNTYVQETVSSLEIPAGVDSLERALTKFTMSETLGSGNEWHCSRCNKKVLAHKSLSFYKPPPVLTFHLKRFGYSSKGGRTKLSKVVTYNETLQLRPFLSTSQRKVLNPVYHLNAVVVHSGSAHGGHYFAYVKAANGQWHEVDDVSVKRVNLHTVLGANAYMLFYTIEQLDMLDELVDKSARQQYSSLMTPPPSSPEFSATLARQPLSNKSTLLPTVTTSDHSVNTMSLSKTNKLLKKYQRKKLKRMSLQEHTGEVKPQETSCVTSVVSAGASLWKVTDLTPPSLKHTIMHHYTDECDGEQVTVKKTIVSGPLQVVSTDIAQVPVVDNWLKDSDNQEREQKPTALEMQRQYQYAVLSEQLDHEYKKRRRRPSTWDAEYDTGHTSKRLKAEQRRVRRKQEREHGGLRTQFDFLARQPRSK